MNGGDDANGHDQGYAHALSPSAPTGPNGRVADAVVAAWHRLVEYWDALFPNAAAGTRLPKDLAAMTALQTQYARTEPQIRALIDRIRAAGTLRYYSRPAYLSRATGGEDGVLGFVRIEIEMEEATRTRNCRPIDEVDRIIERAHRHREEGAQ